MEEGGYIKPDRDDPGTGEATALPGPVLSRPEPRGLAAFFRRRSPVDVLFATLTGAAGVFIIVIVLGILGVLLSESVLSIEKFGPIGFIFSTEWNPVEELFGAATGLFGTAVTTVLALVFAIPVALGIAIFLSEVSPNFLKGPIGVAIELLAAIPSIVFGMWGLFTLAPIMADHVEPALQSVFGDIPVIGQLFAGTPMGIDLFTASVILSIMIVPFAASISRDAFNLTPALVKESAYGLGATKWEVIRDVILPHARLGVFGGIVLSLGRALGETMAVAFVLGNNHQITSSLFDGAASITVTLANEFTEADSDTYLSALFHLALILFVFSLVVLALAKYILLRAQRKERA